MKAKHATLIVLMTLAFAHGAVGQFMYPGAVYTRADLAFGLAEALLMFVWYRFDSDERGFPRSTWLNVGVVGASIIALPYYFFRSRGTRGGARALVLALLCLVAMEAITTAGEYATYYGLQDGLSADADDDAA
jgi:hypothetical protein